MRAPDAPGGDPKPVIHGWWAARRNQVAVATLLVLAVAFAALSIATHLQPVGEVDLAISRGFQRYHGTLLDAWAVGFSTLGSAMSLAVIATVAGIVCWRGGHVRIAALMVATLIGLPLDAVLKVVVGRARPTADSVSVLLPTFGLSFPSGHAMASLMVFGFMAVLAWTHVTPVSRRNAAVAGLIATVVAISLSRIYVGAHWASDVLGGWTAGLFCLAIFARLARRESIAPPS